MWVSRNFPVVGRTFHEELSIKVLMGWWFGIAPLHREFSLKKFQTGSIFGPLFCIFFFFFFWKLKIPETLKNHFLGQRRWLVAENKCVEQVAKTILQTMLFYNGFRCTSLPLFHYFLSSAFCTFGLAFFHIGWKA